jgi:hypothetical protein
MKKPSRKPSKESVDKSVLSEYLFVDKFPPAGSIHDINPLGVYRNGMGKEVVFYQGLRNKPEFVKCSSPLEVDDLITRVFLKATQHSHRHLVIPKNTVTSVLSRIGPAKLFTKRVTGTVLRDIAPAGAPILAIELDSLGPDIILGIIEGNPEELGILHHWENRWGVTLRDSSRIFSLEVVPTPNLGSITFI